MGVNSLHRVSSEDLLVRSYLTEKDSERRHWKESCVSGIPILCGRYRSLLHHNPS